MQRPGVGRAHRKVLLSRHISIAKKAENWCERLSRIMRESGYTQKKSLYEYKE